MNKIKELSSCSVIMNGNNSLKQKSPKINTQNYNLVVNNIIDENNLNGNNNINNINDINNINNIDNINDINDINNVNKMNNINEINNTNDANNSNNINNINDINNIKSININKKKKKTKKKLYIKQLLEVEANNLSYNKAIKYDNRTYFQYYLSLIKQKHQFIYIFYDDNNILMVKIILFIVSLGLTIAVNGLFFNDSSMHRIYKNVGKSDFIYQLPGLIYSSIISFFFFNVIEKNRFDTKYYP